MKRVNSMKTALLNLALVSMLALTVTAAFAGEEENASPPPAAAGTDIPPSANPYQAQIVLAAHELAKSFNQDQALALAQIRSGFGMIRAIRTVEADVGKAVKACGKDNPDMKETIESRFKTWSGSVDPLLKKSGKDMDKAIKAAAFPDEKKVTSYLALLDKAAAHADSRIEKKPVTTLGACNGLMESMNNTEPTMVGLLENISWVVPPVAAEGDEKEPAKKE